MVKKILLCLILPVLVTGVNAQKKKLFAGKQITRSLTIRKGVYQIAGNAGKPLIEIAGDNITVDFSQAVLKGRINEKTPDLFSGTAIYIRGGRNITIKNLVVRGYKVAVLAENTENLRIEHCDFSYNFRQHLNSTPEKEDVSDWLSYHQNGQDEWLRYGAAIYLKNCSAPVISGCTVTGGQNALLMTGCNNGTIFNNDFSFNSGVGIGMYRCSNNTVAFNKLNFNVRGYSDGIYSRGQDSAGILVYEQSNNNFFYRNSVTHSGDGFFLWAGQETMDSGKGGCNDNLISGNDFSYAPTNGVELTFSRNYVLNNRIFECDHGIWGGYSYQSSFSGNKFRNNKTDIAIEHGQDNKITFNIFQNSGESVKLWSRPSQPAGWGYAKYHDTRSRDYAIAFNNFLGVKTAFNIKGTTGVSVFRNIYNGCETVFDTGMPVPEIDTGFNEELDRELSADSTERVPSIPDPSDPFKGSGALAGRKNILITPWGPYDFRYPLIWLSDPGDTSAVMKFKLLGPAGSWKITGWKGVRNISKEAGTFPDSITAERLPGDKTDIQLELSYSGTSFVDQFGSVVPADNPFPFSFTQYFQPIDFNVSWYAMDTAYYNPLKEKNLFSPVARYRPVKTERTNKLDYTWWGGIKADKTYEQFITLADGLANLEKGAYELSVTWDDAVRVYIDGKLVVNEWNPSLYTFDESPNKKIRLNLEAGEHSFRVEHIELGGFATLVVRLSKASN